MLEAQLILNKDKDKKVEVKYLKIDHHHLMKS